MWGSSSSAYLLPDTGPSDLLPSNTAVFSSSVRYNRLWHGILASGILFFILFLGISQSGGVSNPGTYLALAFSLPLLVFLPLLWFLARKQQKEYESCVRSGTWHEGIIVFPSGDIVIRFQGLLLQNIDKTIEGVHFSRAEVERKFSFERCWFRPTLCLYYFGLDAKPTMLSICDVNLADNPIRIAEYMNTLKSQSIKGGASAVSGGGGVL